MELFPVILSGGVGSRLWPVSRQTRPKQFMRFPDGQSLLQKTLLRVAMLHHIKEIITVTNQEYLFGTMNDYSEVNRLDLPLSYIVEPVGRNTAPAIVAAAEMLVSSYGEDSLLMVLPADHMITNVDAFGEAVDEALKVAADGWLVTFGMKPAYAETGYGYIEADKDHITPGWKPGTYQVRRFVEKPDILTAEQYVASGSHFWNSGMFCFRGGTLLEEMGLHAPAIRKTVREALDAGQTIVDSGGRTVELDADRFATAPNTSIDNALMEKSNRVAVVNCEIGWSDIGSWSSVAELAPADEMGNQVRGESILHDARNCYVWSTDRLVAMVGLENVIVVDTPDALLVTNRDRSQDVKHVVQTLKENGHAAHLVHRTVHRPWGSYTILEDNTFYKVKRIEVQAGAILSLQLHHQRSEHWVIVGGVARVTNGDQTFLLNPNETTFIPVGQKHRLENPGAFTLVLIEIQLGEYFGEDDIVRFDDAYGRV